MQYKFRIKDDVEIPYKGIDRSKEIRYLRDFVDSKSIIICRVTYLPDTPETIIIDNGGYNLKFNKQDLN